MASTYSTSLKIQLMGNGEDSGTWGSITNTNWNLIEQAVSGVQSITMANANYTLSNLNGVSDEARNMVIVATGTNSAIYQIIAPLVPKFFVVTNSTTGGYAITIGGVTGSIITVPNGTTVQVYCDGTNFYSAQTSSAGDFNINGNLVVSGNETLGGNFTMSGTSKKIIADFTSSTRVVVQTGTSNSETAFTIIPNGSSVTSNVGCTNTSDFLNCGSMFLRIDSTVASLYSYKVGTGTYLPLNFNVNGAEQMRITTAGGISFGSSGTNYGTSGQVLTSQGNASPIWSNAFPSGGIIMWSGSIASIPSGWYLCNGANSTPNLIDRFVIAAGNVYAVGATGGSTTGSLITANLPSHTHTFSATTGYMNSNVTHSHSVNDPGHSHATNYDYVSNKPTATDANASGTPANSFVNGTQAASTGISLNSADINHTHFLSGTTDGTGSGSGFSILNPYYALAFIMKA